MRSSSNSNPKTLGDASGGSGSGGRPSLLSSSSSSSQDLSPTLTSSSSTPSSPPSPSPPPFPLNIPVPAPPPVLTIESVGPLSPIPTRASPYTPHSALLTPPSLQETPNPFDSLPSPPPDSEPHLPPPPVPPPMHASPPPLAPPALQISIPPPGAGMHDPVLSDPMPFDGPPPPEPDSLDLSFDDEALSALEKIYLFSRSQANFHKVYITHALPSILPQVAPMDAVEYVLPLLSGLAMDDGNGVKEALATELVNIVWWFATNCRLTVDDEYDAEPEHYDSDYAPLSVHTFTPIIGTLLLSSASVGAATRLAVVEILRRVRDARDDDPELLLGAHERKLLEDEIVQQVVVGIGRLDMADEEEDGIGDRPELGPEAEGEDTARADPVDAPQSPPPEQPDYRIGQPATKIASAESARDLAALEVQQQQQRLPSPPPEADAVPVSSIDVADEQAAAEEGLPVEDGQEQDDEVDAEQAAVGRLSSMSLMAAVSAGGLLADDMRETFIREVERVGHDPIYWVRKEASYALGALAKVVPKEIVIMSLLPLFEQFTTDAIWHVRHSALFALPAILSRLSPHDRRSLALRTVSSLSQDPSPPVRTRLLETLGEVMYTFRDDPGGPPDEILQLFVGPDPASSSSRPKTPPDCDDGSGNDDNGTQPPASSAFARARWPGVPLPTPSPTPPNDDGPRPLICAFNLPAVALTLGAARWPELAPLYARLATVRDPKVRKTLAASAGALARVVGRENAWRDVFGVWAAGLRADELEVRTKAVEAVPELVDALGLGLGLGRGEEEESVLGVLERCWNQRTLGWREREALVGALGECVSAERLCEREGAEVFKRIVGCAIEDETAAVRQVGISVMPAVLDSLGRWTDVRASLEGDVCALARAGASRSRVTFVACYRRLVAASPDERWLRDGRFWGCVEELVDDGVVDVRIGVARFVGEVYDRFYGPSASTSTKTPRAFEDVLVRLRADVSAGVRAYVPLARPQPAPCPPSTQSAQHAPSLRADALSPRSPTEKQDRRVFATFSLPPPPPVPSREEDGAELERFGAPLSGPGAPSLDPSEMADPSSTLQQPEKNEASEDSVRTPTMPGPASAGPSGSSAGSSTEPAGSSTSQAEAQHEASGAKSTSSEVVLALATLSAEISPTVRQAVQSQAPASFGGMPTISAPASAGLSNVSTWPSTLPGNFSTSQIEAQQSTSAEPEPALASESAEPSSTSTWPSTLPVGYSASQIETQHESSVATWISPEVVPALAKVTRPDLAPAMTFEAPSTTKHERSARTDLQPAPVGKLDSSSTAQTRSQAPRSAAPQVQTPPSATSTSAPSTAAIVARPGPPAALPSDKCPTPSVSSSLAGSGLGQTSSFSVLSDGGPSRTNHRRAQSFDVSASTKTNPVSLASPSAVVATAGEIDVSAGPAPLSRVPSNLESGTKGSGRAASVRVGAMA